MLLFTSCSHIKTRYSSVEFTKDSCYAKWEDNEAKEKYNKGIGLSREQRSEKRLMIPMMKHSIFIITEIGKDYVVVPPYQGGILTEEGYAEFKKNLSQVLAFDEYDEKKIQELYFWSKKKIKKQWLSEYIKKEQFEKIDCNEIENALFM